MAHVRDLEAYFSEGITNRGTRRIGVEIETSFVGINGKPISQRVSQNILRNVSLTRKRNGRSGDTVMYELGWQNLELSSKAMTERKLLAHATRVLGEMYAAASEYEALPLFEPILTTDEDLLVIADGRDEIWLERDGRSALRPLATTSAVQFTVDVSTPEAIPALNRLTDSLPTFLKDYPQEAIWREYVRASQAGYRQDRYGGPVHFDSLSDYCRKLTAHDVVENAGLVPFENHPNLDIPLFIRSVWWYFRLRRCGNQLCIEVRPLPRRHDYDLEKQMKTVLDIMNL